MTTIGFQGEPGAFSEAAALALVPSAATCGFRTFEDLVAAVDGGSVEFGLLPCENTIHGSIARAYDLLAERAALRIVDETTQPIAQALIGTPDATLESITCIASHPIALDQCRAFLAGRPHVTVRSVDDTAGAVREIVERGDASAAAIGSALAAQRYGGRILLEEVQDFADNQTRFFLIARSGASRRGLGRACLGFELPHRPGSLRDALSVLADRGLNMRNLVARPSRKRPFEYSFYVEFDCTPELDLGSLAAQLGDNPRILGAY